MFRHLLPILLGCSPPFALHAQAADAPAFKAREVPMVMDPKGAFMLCPAKADGLDVHLLIDSGANLEIALLKTWAVAQGKELNDAGKSAGIAGKADLFTTTFKLMEVAGFIELSNFKASVMDVELGMPFPPRKDGSTPVVNGLIGSKFLKNAQAVVSYGDSKLLIPGRGVAADAFLQKSKAQGDRLLPLVMTPSTTAYLPVKFGEKEFLFIVDTAAGGNVILPEIAKELGLEETKSDSKVVGAGGSTAGGPSAIAKDVLIGGQVKLARFDFLIMPSPHSNDLPEGARFGGIIGNGFLSQLRAKVDFGSGHVILPLLGQPNASENRQVVQVAPGASTEQIFEGIVARNYNAVPLTKSRKGQYFVETTINGKARWMCLDSGADGIILDNSIASEDAIELTAGKNAVGADGSSKPVSHGVVNSLSVGPNSFEKASLTFTDLSNFSALTLPDGTTHPSAGLLGLAYFRSLPIAMDFSQKRLLVARQNIKGGLAGIRAQLGDFTAPMIEDSKGRHYLVTETMGQKVLFLVDVGALSTVLYTKGAELLKLESRADQGTVNTLGQKNAPRRVATITDIKFGGHQLNGNVESLVLPGDTVEMVSDLPVVGLVGCTLFEALKSAVDFKADQVTFDPKRFLKAP